MRIGFDAKRYFNNSTGLGNFSRTLVHALAVQFPEDEFILFSETPQKSLAPELRNLSVFYPKRKKLFWRHSGVAYDAAAMGVQVYHGLSNEIPLYLKKYDIRSVVTIHDVIFKKYPDYYPSFDRWIYDRKTRYALRRADAVVAASMATAADLTAYYQFPYSEVAVIYQPITPLFSAETNQQPAEPGKPYFLYVSSFNDRKNHAVLVQALAMIAKQCDWDLVLAGMSGSTLHTVENLVKHEKLSNRIRVVTDVQPDDLVKLMNMAGGFLYPSLAEGFGIPLIEAAACNLPMAVSDIPVFRELAGNAALYFHPNKAAEVADAMLNLSRSEVQVQLAHHRSEIFEKTDPVKIAEQYMQLYKGRN